MKRPLATILAALDSANTYVSGMALEALAFKLMQMLGMTYVATRLKANASAAPKSI